MGAPVELCILVQNAVGEQDDFLAALIRKHDDISFDMVSYRVRSSISKRNCLHDREKTTFSTQRSHPH
jgi:hypothetical protein